MSLSVTIPLGRRLPSRLYADIEGKLTYLSERIITATLVEAEGGQHSACFELDAPDPGLAGATQSLVERMARFFQDLPTEIAWESLCAPTYGGNALAGLEARGDLSRQGAGLYSLGPSLVLLKRMLEEDLDQIGLTLQAEVHIFPSLLSMEVLEKGGYFSSFPHHLTFASRVTRDLGVIGGIGGSGAKLTDAIDRALVAPEHALQPNLCFHCYALMEGRNLARNLVISCQGVCFRHEGIRFHGLDRLFEFTMREFVFLGDPDFVLAGRDQLMKLTQDLVQAWGLAARLETASDPFFADVYASRRLFQLATKAKYELLAPMPYEDKLLAIGSFNLHGEFFAKPFAIQSGDACAQTGCVGFGLERWLYAFLAQHGPDREGWPASVRDRFLGLAARPR